MESTFERESKDSQVTLIEELDLSGFDTSKVTDMKNLFKCAKIRKIKLGKNFITTEVTSMNSMFQWYKDASIDLSTFDTSSVTDMYAMFRQTLLTSLDLSTFDTSNVKSMADMFFESLYLHELDLSSFDFSKVTSGTNMFTGMGFKVEDKQIIIYASPTNKTDIERFLAASTRTNAVIQVKN